jgi:hypothetical protein
MKAQAKKSYAHFQIAHTRNPSRTLLESLCALGNKFYVAF